MDTTFWLIASVAMTGCSWMPYVLERFATLGAAGVVANPGGADGTAHSAWALRARAAHANAVENLAVFAPLALATIHFGASTTPLAVSASATYFFARLAHYLLYAAGVRVARTLAFLAGFGAQCALAFVAATAGVATC